MEDRSYSVYQINKDLKLLEEILENGPCGLCKFFKANGAPCSYCPAQSYDY